jgi:hypothetical protein
MIAEAAREYFQNKFGFKEAKRSPYDERLADSPEWILPLSVAFVTKFVSG